MNIIWVIIPVLIVVFLLALVLYYAYLGGFSRIEIRVSEEGGEKIVFEDLIGDYKQTGEVMKRVYQRLQDENILTTKGIGIYYDNPKEVEKDKLRSEIGEILQDGLTDEQMEELDKTFRIKTLPKGNYITVEFPFKGFSSIYVGIRKVYPMMFAYATENEIVLDPPSMEIYDMERKVIIYRCLIAEK